MVQRLGLIGLLLYIMVSFQNCSKVDFAGTDTQASTKGTGETPPESVPDDSHPPDDTVTDDEDEVIDEVVSRNKACDPIFKSGSFMDLKGQDFKFNGVSQELLLANGKNVKLNGVTDVLAVNGAKEIESNGFHQAICLKGEKFRVSGSAGMDGSPVVLIGSNATAEIQALNGVVFSELVLIDIKNTGSLNGANFHTYIYGGNVESINGAGFDLHLMKGTHVKKINGFFRNIYLYDGSSIGFLNGHYKLVRVKKI